MSLRDKLWKYQNLNSMNIHEFNPVIYPYKVWIVINKNPAGIADRFKEYDGSKIVFAQGDVDRSEAFTMPVQSKEKPLFYGVVLFFRSKKSMSYELVAHEASHAAKYLFDHIGADVSHHEPFEYVIGWIARCCEEVKRYKANGKIERK